MVPPARGKNRRVTLLTKNAEAALRRERITQRKKATQFWSKESFNLSNAEEADRKVKELTDAIKTGKLNKTSKEAVQRLIDDLAVTESFWAKAMAAKRGVKSEEYKQAFAMWKVFHPGKAGPLEFNQWLDRFDRKKNARESYLVGVLKNQ